MKYEIIMHRTERKTVHIFAPDKDAAIKAAHLANTGFEGSCLVELGDGDEPVAEHVKDGECERCGKALWLGDDYIHTDDGLFCGPCLEK